MPTRREYRSPLFDDGMVIAVVGPETDRRTVGAPPVDGDPCRHCGGTRWTFHANPARRYRQSARCEGCGRHEPIKLKEVDRGPD